MGREAPEQTCYQPTNFKVVCYINAFTFDNVEAAPQNFEQNPKGENRKKSLRFRIQQLAKAEPFIDNEDFCKLLGIDYDKNKHYVRKERYLQPERHHRMPDGKLVRCKQ